MVRRDASLEVLLVNDGGQLGQLPKLSTLAMAALRFRLLRELDLVVQTLPRSALKDLDMLSDSDIVSPHSKGGTHALSPAAQMADLHELEGPSAPELELQIPHPSVDGLTEECRPMKAKKPSGSVCTSTSVFKTKHAFFLDTLIQIFLLHI